MHDISLRSGTNLMDAHNLALVLCPNLISGHQALRDMSMCTIPGGPVHHASMHITPMEGKTTLAAVIKLCIQRYYEIFDETRDRSEAVAPQRSLAEGGPPSPEASSGSGSVMRHIPAGQVDDDDDIDDAMLVMPIGPTVNTQMEAGPSQVPPSAWSLGVSSTEGTTTYKPRRREPAASGTQSMHTASGDSGNRTGFGNGNGHYVYPSMNKAKSTISIENGRNGGTSGRKGSISVGRGTTRKSSGAGVEAISVTAEGFFAAPSSPPPVPSRRRG